MDKVGRFVAVDGEDCRAMLEDFDDVDKMLVHKDRVVGWSFPLVKLDILQNIVHQMLRGLGVVLGEFQNESAAGDLAGPLFVAF